MTIKEVAIGTMIPSHKRFMEEEVFPMWNTIEDINFDDEFDENSKYEFSAHDEATDSYLTVHMSWNGTRLNIDYNNKNVRKDMTAIFEDEDEGDEYHFEED